MISSNEICHTTLIYDNDLGPVLPPIRKSGFWEQPRLIRPRLYASETHPCLTIPLPQCSGSPLVLPHPMHASIYIYIYIYIYILHIYIYICTYIYIYICIFTDAGIGRNSYEHPASASSRSPLILSVSIISNRKLF